jgi:glyoxylase-like metal-dependent hydrolase (beta-lactamase superfamily II)
MTAYICRTCGVQYPPAEEPPRECIICEDERQYIAPYGQQWTSLEKMQAEGYGNTITEVDPGVHAVRTTPPFAITQRALLLVTDGGNFLWDCISYLDEATVAAVEALGGLQGIALSHPHFYGVMCEWSNAFGAPIYLPEADREWVVRQDAAIEWVAGRREIWPGLTWVQCGGHFEGSAVVHWAGGAEGRGALFAGDTIAPAQDRRYVTFMRSFPNYIPMSEVMVKGITDAVAPFEFDRIYGGWSEVRERGKWSVEESAARYVRWLRNATGG